MANQRVTWACQAFGIAPDGTNNFVEVHGLQNIGINKAFTLEPIFQIGQSSLYENKETLPTVELTVEKLLDGYPLMLCLATQDAITNSLQGRGKPKCITAINVYPDDASAASGDVIVQTTQSGMFVDSVSYNFPVDGNFTEQITFVGNAVQVLYGTGQATFFPSTLDGDDRPAATTGVQRRENFSYAYTYGTVDSNGSVTGSGCILPQDIPGITASGTNPTLADGFYRVAIQDVSVEFSFAREDANQQGKKIPFLRLASPNIEVTTSISFLDRSGDLISMNPNSNNNVADRTIQLQTSESTTIYLGKRNKLSTTSRTGGDAGGGNASWTYTYSNYNDFVITHTGDPTF